MVHNLDVPAQIIGGRTMLPIAAVVRSVGYEVDWDAETRTVVITSRAEAPVTLPQPPVQEPVVETEPEEAQQDEAAQDEVTEEDEAEYEAEYEAEEEPEEAA